MNKTSHKTFEFKIYISGKVMVTDPCYDIDTWCASDLELKEGEYIAKVERYDLNDGWGARNYSLTINHISCPKKKATHLTCYCGVDSGQLGIFNYDYYEKNQPNDDWYADICDITMEDNKCGNVDGVGVVTESGCGDGEYKVHTGVNSKGEIVAVKVSFE